MTREERLQKKREYYQRNKEREKEKNRKRYQERKEQYRIANKRWQEEHKDEVREYKRNYAREHYARKIGDSHNLCSEPLDLIENYDKAIEDNFEGWVLHHRLEDKGFSMQELKEKRLYYRRPASELIYMTKEEHDEHHSKMKRKECRCIETGEVHYVNEWRKMGFPLAGDVANGKYVSHHNLHFVWT